MAYAARWTHFGFRTSLESAFWMPLRLLRNDGIRGSLIVVFADGRLSRTRQTSHGPFLSGPRSGKRGLDRFDPIILADKLPSSRQRLLLRPLLSESDAV